MSDKERLSALTLSFSWVAFLFFLGFDHQRIVGKALQPRGMVPGSALRDAALFGGSPSQVSRRRSVSLVWAANPLQDSTIRYLGIYPIPFRHVRLVPSNYRTPVFVSGFYRLHGRLSTE